MKLRSSAFENNSEIPRKYTGEGENISPPLEWEGLPPRCKSLVLICEDPDAATAKVGNLSFVHWLLYNLRREVSFLPEGIEKTDQPAYPEGSFQGTNSFGKSGYGGPIPPPGSGLHHYVFTLYALKEEIKLNSRLTRTELLNEIKNEVLETAVLVGTYERQPEKSRAQQSA